MPRTRLDQSNVTAIFRTSVCLPGLELTDNLACLALMLLGCTKRAIPVATATASMLRRFISILLVCLTSLSAGLPLPACATMSAHCPCCDFADQSPCNETQGNSQHSQRAADCCNASAQAAVAPALRKTPPALARSDTHTPTAIATSIPHALVAARAPAVIDNAPSQHLRDGSALYLSTARLRL